jgi:polygalacturonase
VVNVLDFVSDRTGATLQRENLQRALDAIAARPDGGTLYFPAGTYLTGTLVIHRNTSVYLESGALLQGTANPKDYYVAASEPPRATPGKGTGALLYFVDAENSRLIGRGTVAAQGTKIRQLVADHPRICNFIRCKNCEIADVVIRDSGGFNIHALRCENLSLHGYKIINDLALSNQDGTDPDSSRHIIVDDVFMYTSDDAIAVKADIGLCEDVVVKNCVFWTKKSALKVGSDPYYGARNIVFENDDVLHSDRALALYARMGFIEKVRFAHNTAEFVGDDIKQQTIVFLVSKLGPGGETSVGKKSPYTGYVKDVLVDGFLACRSSPKPSVIQGDGPGHEVSHVTIRNYYLGGRPVKSAADATIEIGADSREVTFEISGAPPAEVGAMRLPAWAK